MKTPFVQSYFIGQLMAPYISLKDYELENGHTVNHEQNLVIFCR
jgi:hypothetical protein